MTKPKWQFLVSQYKTITNLARFAIKQDSIISELCVFNDNISQYDKNVFDNKINVFFQPVSLEHSSVVKRSRCLRIGSFRVDQRIPRDTIQIVCHSALKLCKN